MFFALDWNIVVPELIGVFPNCLWMGFIIVLALCFRDELKGLLGSLTKIGAFGVEVEFSERTRTYLENAMLTYPVQTHGTEHLNGTQEEDINRVFKLAQKKHNDLRGARILWVDRTPLANANIHRFLNALGITIDNTDSTDQAVEAIRWSAQAYEVVITNMKRKESDTAGLDLVARIKELSPDTQIILFVGHHYPELGTPAGVYQVTDRVDALMMYVFQIIEAARALNN